MPAVRSIKVRPLKPKEKALAVVALPILQIMTFLTGFSITAYLYGTTFWMHRTFSYLATNSECSTSFGLTMLIAILLGYAFLVTCFIVLFGNHVLHNGDKNMKVSFVLFTLAYIILSIAAVIPTTPGHLKTWNYYVHIASAWGFFLLYPHGVYVFMKALPDRYHVLKVWTKRLIYVFIISIVVSWLITRSALMVEVVSLLVFAAWSLLLARTLAGELYKKESLGL